MFLQRIFFWWMRRMRPHTKAPPRTILVLQFMQPLGCCVHGTPLYAGIKAAAPNCKLIVATRGLGLHTIQHDPHIDVLLEVPELPTSMKSLWSAARELRQELKQRGLRPDLVLQDGNNRRPSFTIFAALLHLAPTAGFSDLQALYDFPFAYDWSRSLIDNNLRLTALVGQQVPHLEPAVYFNGEELARARGLLHEATGAEGPVAAFTVQGSGSQRTGWHDDRFAAVLQHVASLGYRIVFLGTAADTGTIERIRAASGGLGSSLAGRTNIPELAAVLCLCDLMVSLDTGTMHVGRAVGIPLVVLGPCWQKPIEWLPLDVANARVLRGADRKDVPEDYRLDEIQPPDVIAAIDSLLANYPPTATAREQRVSSRLSER
jgi:ADP-heptose:LPS heptosyltransferase